MSPFRRVDGEHAGPQALGILVPPARQTFVILRPRGLPWDLVLCRGPEDLAFRVLSHDEASAAAQAIWRLLREVTPHIDTQRDAIRVTLGPMTLLLCARVPGQPYTPMTATTPDDTIAKLREVLCPTQEQEVYFNTRFFDRTS